MPYDKKPAENRRKACGYKKTSQRDGCHNCTFVELRSVLSQRGKAFHCNMERLPVAAYGICDKYVKKEKS